MGWGGARPLMSAISEGGGARPLMSVTSEVTGHLF